MQFDWNLGTIIAATTFILGVVGSITRVLLKQNSDSELLKRVEEEVQAVQKRKDQIQEQVSRHETEIAVLKQIATDIKEKVDQTHKMVSEKLK